jgi:hypothetical protein
MTKSISIGEAIGGWKAITEWESIPTEARDGQVNSWMGQRK